MIENINDFVKAYDQVAQSQIDIIEGKSITLRKWVSLDFDITKINDQLDSIDNQFLYSIVKRAYDIIRTYHRAFMVYKQTRDDYYDFAKYDIYRDIKIMHKIVDNLNTLNTIMENKISEMTNV